MKKKNGEHIKYYENGIIKLKRNFKNGELEGKSIKYYENGTIEKQMNYKAGKLV